MLRKKKDDGVYRVRNTRKIYFPVYLMAGLLVGFLAFLFFRGLPINTMALGLIVLFIFLSIKYTELHRLNNSYEIDSHDVIHTEGLINKKIKRGDLVHVRYVDINQSVLQRLFGYGDVMVDLFSEKIPVRNIDKPLEFQKVLEDKIAEKKRNLTKKPDDKK